MRGSMSITHVIILEKHFQKDRTGHIYSQNLSALENFVETSLGYVCRKTVKSWSLSLPRRG